MKDPIKNTETEDSSSFRSKIHLTLRLLYYLRLQFLGVLFLLLFPLVGLFLQRQLFLGLFDLSRGYDLDGLPDKYQLLAIFLASLALFFLSWSLVLTSKTILFYGGDRFGLSHRISVRATSRNFNLLFFFIGVGLTVPFHLAIFTVTFEQDRGSYSFWASLLAVAAAFLAFLIVTALVEYFHRANITDQRDAKSTRGFVFPFSTRITRSRESKKRFSFLTYPFKLFESYFLRLPPQTLRGYVRGKEDEERLNPEHLLNMLFFASFLVIFGLVGVAVPLLIRNLSGNANLFAPTIVSIVLQAALVLWILAGVFFYLDGTWLPTSLSVVIFFIAVAFGLYLFNPVLSSVNSHWRSAHFYHGDRSAIAPEGLKTPREMILRNDPASESREFVVLVAAEGGGIQAAAWTARVITGLEQKCMEIYKEAGVKYAGQCSRRIRLISGASGGSVGAMFVAASFGEQGLPADKPALDAIVTRASKSSLDAAAWGLVYPDSARFLGLPMYSGWSRGVALEKQWERNSTGTESQFHVARDSKATLDRWGSQRFRPSLIFNATIVETGERLLITDTAFESDGGCKLDHKHSHQPTFRELTRNCGNIDLRVSTAARLSSSFPFVSPTSSGLFENSKPCVESSLHIADGGYHDNFGTASLIDWLEEALSGIEEEQLIGQKFLIIQITSEQNSPSVTGRKPRSDLLLQWYSPLLTLNNIRSEAQRSTSASDLKDFQRYWNAKLLNVVAGSEEVVPVFERPVSVVEFDFRGGPDENPPLSWHLTPGQKANIQKEWNKHSGADGNNESEAMKEFKRFLCYAEEGLKCG